jgi:hypothetical protein
MVEFKIIVIEHKRKPNSDKMQVFYRLAESCSVLSAFHATSVCEANVFKYMNNEVLILSPVNSKLF